MASGPYRGVAKVRGRARCGARGRQLSQRAQERQGYKQKSHATVVLLNFFIFETIHLTETENL